MKINTELMAYSKLSNNHMAVMHNNHCRRAEVIKKHTTNIPVRTVQDKIEINDAIHKDNNKPGQILAYCNNGTLSSMRLQTSDKTKQDIQIATSSASYQQYNPKNNIVLNKLLSQLGYKEDTISTNKLIIKEVPDFLTSKVMQLKLGESFFVACNISEMIAESSDNQWLIMSVAKTNDGIQMFYTEAMMFSLDSIVITNKALSKENLTTLFNNINVESELSSLPITIHSSDIYNIEHNGVNVTQFIQESNSLVTKQNISQEGELSIRIQYEMMNYRLEDSSNNYAINPLIEEYAQEIINYKPADGHMMFIMAKQNGINLHIQQGNHSIVGENNPQYLNVNVLFTPGKQDENGNYAVGHFELLDTQNQVIDIASSGVNNCGFDIFSYLTGKSVKELRNDVSCYVLNNSSSEKIVLMNKYMENFHTDKSNNFILKGGVDPIIGGLIGAASYAIGGIGNYFAAQTAAQATIAAATIASESQIYTAAISVAGAAVAIPVVNGVRHIVLSVSSSCQSRILKRDVSNFLRDYRALTPEQQNEVAIIMRAKHFIYQDTKSGHVLCTKHLAELSSITSQRG